MYTLFFDTETTGFPNKKLPTEHRDQPHLLQLAFIVDDKTGNTVDEFCEIIKPTLTFQVPEAAYRIHGISYDRALKVGASGDFVLSLFHEWWSKCDRVVAHNYAFDVELMKITFARSSIKRKKRATVPDVYCTMLRGTNVLKIPGRYGKYKWPSLDEAYRVLVDKSGFEGAHDALNDVRACRKVYYALQDLGVT